MDDVNILLTSVGRRVELVRAIKHAYQKRGIAGRIVGTDIDPLAPALREVDVPVLVPPCTHQDYVRTLVETCDLQGVTAVFPLIDPDIPILARHGHLFDEVQSKVGVVDPNAASICGDKWKTNSFFKNLGLAAPQSWLPGAPDILQHEFPLFVKPRGGSAARHTYRVNNKKELAFFQDYVDQSITQEYLPGPEVTSDVFCDFDGNVISIVSRQRIAVRGGEVTKGVTIYDPRIADACESIAKQLPAVGPITVQCMMRDDIPHFIEINARLGGGIPLAIAAGVDVPGYLVAMACGETVTPMEAGKYVQGLYMTRFDDSFFTTAQSDVKLESSHI